MGCTSDIFRLRLQNAWRNRQEEFAEVFAIRDRFCTAFTPNIYGFHKCTAFMKGIIIGSSAGCWEIDEYVSQFFSFGPFKFTDNSPQTTIRTLFEQMNGPIWHAGSIYAVRLAISPLVIGSSMKMNPLPGLFARFNRRGNTLKLRLERCSSGWTDLFHMLNPLTLSVLRYLHWLSSHWWKWTAFRDYSLVLTSGDTLSNYN